MHLKRHKVPKSWPVKRKGTKYVVRGNSNLLQGIPILILIRDLMGIAKNRKEVKKIVYKKKILLNSKLVKDEKNVVNLFDVLHIVPSKKYYRIVLSERGVFDIEEIKEKEPLKKISKIINKKVLKGKKTQLNLSDGFNFISDIKCNTNDSVVIDFQKNRIEKCLPLKEKSAAFVFAGKHAGKRGTIQKIDQENKMAELKSDKKNIHVLIKQIMVVE